LLGDRGDEPQRSLSADGFNDGPSDSLDRCQRTVNTDDDRWRI
jgi:hypothetical protein